MPEYFNKQNFLAVFFIAFICIIIYANSLFNPFIWDDSWLILDNSLIRNLKNLPQIFKVNLTYISQGVHASNFYRPLQSLSYMLDYYFYGLKPFGYHLVNVVLHALNAILVYFLILLITRQRVVSFVSSILFAVHPIHNESVSYISGRADLLVAFFILLSVIFFVVFSNYTNLKRTVFYLISAFCFILALLSKELAIILPLVLIMYDLTFRKENLRSFNSFIRVYSLFIIIDLIYIFLRLTVLKFGDGVYLTGHYSLYSRLVIVSHGFNMYFRLLFLPLDLHMCRIFNLSLWLLNPMTLFSVLSSVLFFILLFYSYRKSKLIFFAGAWYAILLLPQSGIYPINAFVADHFLYLPSVGFFLMIGLLLTKYFSKKIMIILAMVLACFYSTITVINNYGWQNEEAFYRRITRLSPLCANAYINLGVYYRNRGLLQEAEKQFSKAVSLNKNDYLKRVYLAEVYILRNRLDDARDQLDTILKNLPGIKDANIYNNLGYIYQMKKDYTQAIAYYKQALEINPDFILARYNLTRAYINLGKNMEGFIELEKAIGIEGLLTSRAKDGPTEKELKEVIKQNKEYGGIFNELAMLFSKYNRFEVTEKIFLRAAELYPNNVETRFNLGVLYYNLGLYDKANAQWNSALKINPHHLSSQEWLRILQNK